MPKQTGVNYGADLLLRSVGDNPSQRQGPITGFNYDTVPRTRERPLVGAQDVRSYLEWLGQGGGLQNLNALGQGLFGPQGRQTVSDIAHNVQGPVQPLGLGMGGPNEMMGQAMDFLNPMAKVGGILGQTVFHGSPHKFDKFDISKIGTGEGAQVYGHGLYFADNPEVAKSYRRSLSKAGRATSLTDEMDMLKAGNERLLDKYDIEADPEFLRHITEENYAGAKDYAKKRVNKWSQLARDKEYQFQEYASQKTDAWERLLPEIEAGKVEHSGIGALYKVDIPDADIPRMLDWDKPFSEQSGFVQQALKQAGIEPPNVTGRYRIEDQGGGDGFAVVDNIMGRYLPVQFKTLKEAEKQVEAFQANAMESFIRDNTGLGIHQTMTETFGGQRGASEALQGLGIPGIKYYDQGSRGLGQGTRNYVTFGDEGLKILERN